MTAQKTEGPEERSPSVSPAVNHVRLVGALTADAVQRELPSGDTVWSFGVRVPRPEDHATRQKSDTLDCAVWHAGLARRAAKWREGDLVEVEGALRRRFYRSPSAGLVSRWEVEVGRGRIIRRATSG